MDFGVSTWIFAGLPTIEAVHELAEKGIEFVELAFRNLALSSTSPRLRSEYAMGQGAWALEEGSIPARRIREEIESMRITPVQMHAPQFDLAHPNEDLRRASLRKTMISLDVCAQLGVPALVVHPGVGTNPGPDDRSGIQRVRSDTLTSISALATRASDLGVRIAVENAGHSQFGSTALELAELVAATDPEVVTTCVDTGHAIKKGIPPSEMILELGPDLGATHLHDNDGNSDQHLPPLCGIIDWEKVSSSLRAVGYPNPPIAEIQGSENVAVGRNRTDLTIMAMESILE